MRFFACILVKSRRTAKYPNVLSSLLAMVTIPFNFGKIYFLTKFRIFYKEIHHVFLRKMAKIKHFQVLMPMDWKLNYEFNEV